jgi:excisionase family DNA binding protein
MARRVPPRDEELLTVGDAAALLGLSGEMVRVLHRRGKLSAERTPGGYRLFRRGDVERLVRERGARQKI